GSMRSTRRSPAVLVVAVALVLAVAGAAQAKFGMSKTRVTLKRVRPPEIPLVGDTVSVAIDGKARSVAQRDLDVIRNHVETAISADHSKRLVERGADSAVRIVVEDLDSRINDSVTYETKYVKIGERQEWDDKKKKMVTKDVYGNRTEPVRLRNVRGKINAHVEVESGGGRARTADAGASYEDQFKGEVKLPEQASSENALERYLVDRAADHAAATVTFSPDPVEAL